MRIGPECGPTTDEVGGLERQHQAGAHIGDVPAAGAVARGIDDVARSRVLPLGDHPVGAVDAQSEEVLKEVIAVEPATIGADLGQPRPDLAGWCVDRDGAGVLSRRLGDQGVARQREGDLGIGRPPAVLPGLQAPRIGTDGQCPSRHRRAEEGPHGDARWSVVALIG